VGDLGFSCDMNLHLQLLVQVLMAAEERLINAYLSIIIKTWQNIVKVTVPSTRIELDLERLQRFITKKQNIFSKFIKWNGVMGFAGDQSGNLAFRVMMDY